MTFDYLSNYLYIILYVLSLSVIPAAGKGEGELLYHPFVRLTEKYKNSADKRGGRRDKGIYSWLDRLTANAPVATVLGSIPASVGTVESEGRQMKQC
jgi:hypothetical protein